MPAGSGRLVDIDQATVICVTDTGQGRIYQLDPEASGVAS
jgi:hypothetical protein